MKDRKLVILVLGLIALLATGTAAQHTQHHPEQTPPQQKAKSQAASGGMMARHAEMTKLLDELSESLTALEAEKDPAIMKKKLAEHRVLIEQLQSKMKGCSEMMQQMNDHMEKCPMMRSERKPD